MARPHKPGERAIRVVRATLALICALMAVPAPVWAQAAPDFDLKDGRFYTQTAPSGGGYSVTDADGVRFWSVFQRLGGPAVVGYPVSRRFVMNGIPTQA